MSLEECLEKDKVDKIEDTSEFYDAECSAIYNYCNEREFNISDDDLYCLSNRGLLGCFIQWKEDYEENLCDGGIVATIDIDDDVLLKAMRANEIPITQENFLSCERLLAEQANAKTMEDSLQEYVNGIVELYKYSTK